MPEHYKNKHSYTSADSHCHLLNIQDRFIDFPSTAEQALAESSVKWMLQAKNIFLFILLFAPGTKLERDTHFFPISSVFLERPSLKSEQSNAG